MPKGISGYSYSYAYAYGYLIRQGRNSTVAGVIQHQNSGCHDKIFNTLVAGRPMAALLPLTTIGRSISFWLFASLALIAPLLLWRWWLRRDAMVRLDLQFLALARKDGLSRATHEGRMNFARRWAEEMPFLETPVHRFADIFCRLRYGAPVTKEEQAAAQSELRERLQLIRKLRRNRAGT